MQKVLFRRMEADGLLPDAVSFTTLMTALVEMGELEEAVRRPLPWLLVVYMGLTFFSIANLQQAAVTNTSYLALYEYYLVPIYVQTEVFAEMESHGMEPDEAALNMMAFVLSR
eukprot:scaffold155757_cov31-Prasinocladus_malaysianus.AAC.1